MFIPLNYGYCYEFVLRGKDLIIRMQKYSVQNKNNNNNCAITSSQFEEDNFFIFQNASPSYLNDANGVACLFKCASCVELLLHI